jgi:hypothetical protein
LLLAAAVGRVDAQTNWPGFRGANNAGVSAAAVPTSWDLSSSQNVAWKTPIPGLAHSSPIVWGDRIYVTTAVPASGRAEVKTGDVEKSGIDSATDTGPAHLAADRRRSRKRQDRLGPRGAPGHAADEAHVKASHASATPAPTADRSSRSSAAKACFCFDMEGRQKWRADLGVMDVGLVDDPSYQWGPASSPVIFEDRVIVQNDRHKKHSLQPTIWRAERALARRAR